MSESQVSVIIPTRNRLSLLQEAINSVQAQTFRDWEMIVVDDASEDETWAWLQTVAGPRIRPIRLGKHSERSAARNRGLANARGGYVLFLDDDDLLLGLALERLVRALEEKPRAIAAKCGLIYFGVWEDLPPWPRQGMVRDVFWDVFYGVPLGGAGVLYRTQALRGVGGLYEGLSVGEDRVGGLRVAAQGFYLILPQRLMLVRTGSGGNWDYSELKRSHRVAQEEAARWAPVRHLRRLPSAVQGLPHFVAFQEALGSGRRALALLALVHALRLDPGLLRARLLWRVMGSGFLKHLLPRSVRYFGRTIRWGVLCRSKRSMRRLTDPDPCL